MGWTGSRRRGLRVLLCTLVGLLVLPGVADAAECTDTWVGSEAGQWTVAENWSAGHVPTETDVACIPKSNRVTVGSGLQRVEILQGGGELVITEAALTLVGLTEPSNIGTLRLKEGGELGGSGELWVTDLLVGAGGLMKGDGFTKVGAEATGTVVGGEFEGQPGLRVTQERVLSVHGSLDVGGEGGELRVIEGAVVGGPGNIDVNGPTGAMVLRESAALSTSGTLDVAGAEAQILAWESATLSNTGKLAIAGTNSEVRLDSADLQNSGEMTLSGSAARLLMTEAAKLENLEMLVVNSEAEGSGVQLGTSSSPPHLENFGTIVKTQGTGTATIEVTLDNEGLVETESGELRLSGGGTSGKLAQSAWAALSENLYAAETKLVFAEENFAMGEAAVVGEAQLVAGAAVTAESMDGEVGSFWLDGGNLHLSGAENVLGELGVADGTASVAAGADLSSGYLEITQEQGAFQMAAGAALDAAVFIDAGSFTAGEETTIAGSDFSLQGGTFEAGPKTQFLSKEPFVSGGDFELGVGSAVGGDYFFQEEGSTTFGASTTITEPEFLYIEEGPMVFGAGTTVTLGEYFFQQGGETEFGPGAALEAGEMAYFEEGPVAIEAGAEVEAEEVFFQDSAVALESEAEVLAHRLDLYAGEITGTGMIETDVLNWWDTVMAGAGITEVLEEGKIGHGTVCSEGTCEDTPAYATLRERELILQGSFTLTVSTMGLADGAKLVNLGDFDASSELSKWGPQMQIAAGSSADPKIVNRGRFEKLEGSGTTVVDVPFWNFGVVRQRSGTLDLKQRRGVSAREKFGNKCPCGEPIEAASGDFYESQTDFAIGGLGVGLRLARTYDASAAASAISPGIFGYGWFSSFGDRLELEEEGARITVERADGSTVPFVSDGEGGYDPPTWSQDTLSGSAEAGYIYRSANQIERHFDASGTLQSVVDRNGNETTLAYDEAGRLKTIEDPAGRQVVLSYNGAGLVESAEDPMGHVVHYGYEGKELTSVTMPGDAEPRWRFDYDASHLMTKVIEGRGGQTTNEYDASGRVISQTDPAGRELVFEYDGFHTRVTNEATGAVTDYWFDSNNQPTSVTRGYGTTDATTDTFSYDEAGHQLSRTDGNGHTTTYTYNAAGDRTSVTDADENKTEWIYNAAHDVLSETTPKGETTTIVRDAAGNPETVSRPAPGGATQTTSYDYNSLGQLESLTDPLERTWTFEYDGNGNLKAETDSEGDTRSWGYDEDSRVISLVRPRGNEEGTEPSEFTTTLQRDPQGRTEEVTDPLGHATAFAYDGNGNLASATNAKGKTTEFVYNADDELIETKKPDGAVLKTEYNGAGEVVAQIDGNEEKTTYVRNVLEQPVEVIDPLNRKTVQEFDDAGNLKTLGDPAERTATYSYDPADRLEGIDYSSEATPDVSFEYDADGNLTKMVDGSGESTYVYDQLGRLEEATNGHGDTVSYEYDLAGQQTKIVYPNGKDVDRAFDGAGRLESVTDWLGKTTTFAYDADSNLEATQFPASTGNVDEFSYDRTGRMTGVDFKKGAESLASVAYERDPLGQVEAMVSEGLPGPEEEAYEYDDDNRLVKAGAEEFGYDKADNPTKTPGSTNALDGASQLESGTGLSYTYNLLGERTGATATGSAPNYVRQFGGESSGAGQLSAPSGIATDPEGNVWVADTAHDRIQEFDSEGEFVGQFGTAGSGNGQLRSPRGIALDAKGNVWVADTGNNRIQEFKPSGEFIRAFGTSGEGNGQFRGLQDLAVDSEGHVWSVETGKALPRVQQFSSEGAYISQFGSAGSGNGQLSSPRGIAVDSSGNVWVADTSNNRVQAFKPSGEFIRKFGALGEGAGQLNAPQDLAFDAEGKVWVADTGNNRMQRFTAEGAYLAQFGASGPNAGEFAGPQALTVDVEGNLWVADTGNDRVQEVTATEFLRQFGGEGSGPGHLSAPAGIAIDAEGDTWVADTAHNRVQEFDGKGEFIRQFGTAGTGNGQFNAPRGIAIGPNGNVWVADTGNNRVQAFKPSGEFVAKFGTEGAANGQFGSLQDLAVDAEGHVFTIDAGKAKVSLKPRVQKFSSAGIYLSQFGAEGSENGQFKEPRGIGIDASGNVWVADTGNNRVQAFKPIGEFIRKFGTLGEGNGQLKAPQDLAVDPEGNLWVADTGNDRMQRFSSEGSYLSQFGTSGPNGGQFSEPKGIATDAAGNVWVADTGNDRVQGVTATEFLLQFGGESSGPGRLSAPAGTATDSEGNVWVADTAHNRIQEFNARGEFLSQFGATGTANGQLRSPRGIAIGGSGNVFVADTGNNRVQVFKPSGEFITKFGVEGTGAGQFRGLTDLAVDSSGNVWTIEGGKAGINTRVQKFSSAGAYVSQFGTEGTADGQFKEPRGIAIDASGNVWVADAGNNRVQAFKPSGEFIRKFGTLGEGNGQLKSPQDLTFDTEGNAWVADTGNNRVEGFSAEGAYLAQFGAAGPEPGQLSAPLALSADAKGNLWVADTGNDRVGEWRWPRSSTYGYDQAGNLTSVQVEAGKVPIASESFAYDGSGLMTAKTSGSETRHLAWDLSSPLPLLLDDGENSYVYGPYGLPIAQISAAEEPTYLHHDQLGSTRMLTDATGSPTATFTYTAYGELAGKTGTATTPLGYAGQYTDAETGLQYLRARFYDPATAQFLSRDPVEALTREPYAYGRSNPMGNVDPSGLYPAEEEGEVECWGCLRFPTAEEIEDAAEEVADAADEFWNWITGDDDSTAEPQPKLSKEEQEYEEEHHECPLERNWRQDKKVTERELEEANLDAHELKRGQGGTDIYKDREGNLYEKPHGGRGPGTHSVLTSKINSDRFR